MANLREAENVRALSNGDSNLTERVRNLRLPSRADGPSGGIAWLPWTLCVLLAGSTASLGMRVYSGQVPQYTSNSSTVATAEGDTPKPVVSSNPSTGQSATAVPATNPGEPVVVQKGYIIPAHRIAVSPIEVSGQIIELCPNRQGRPFGEGTAYEKGDPIARIDPTLFEQEVREAESALLAVQQRLAETEGGFELQRSQAMAELEEAKAQLRQAALEYQRTREVRAGAMAQRENEQAEAAYRAGDQRVRRLTAALKLIETTTPLRIEAIKGERGQAEARLKRAQWRLGNCVIRAPVTGTILEKKAELGNLVNPLAFGATSGSLCEMADLTDLEVDVEIQEREVAKVFKGQKCRIRCADAYPDRVYEGIVDRLMPIANRAKGAIPVRVKLILPEEELKDQGKYLKPEMGAVISFMPGENAKSAP